MAAGTTLDEATRSKTQNAAAQRSTKEIAARAGVSVDTLRRALRGEPVAESTAIALRRAITPRKRSDYTIAARTSPPRPRDTATSWTIESIRAAIESQMRGEFERPVRLAESARRDDSIYVARRNRIEPIRAIATKLEQHESGRGLAVAKRARTDVIVPRTTLVGIDSTLVDHGIAIGYVEHTPNDSGTRIAMRLTEWPLEHVRYNRAEDTLETRTASGQMEPITHGDGRWIVFRAGDYMPWREAACILPAAFVWAAHSEGIADWQSSSRAHGLAKIIGELPEGSALTEDDEDVPDVVSDFLDALRDIVEGETNVAIKPFGAKAEFIANSSTAWQVFKENIESREKAAARIYLGTDAMLGSVGGAPGVDISALFGVLTTKLQGDFDAIEDGLDSGLYVPWTAINFGDARYAPALRFQLPDPDENRKHEALAANRERLTAIIEGMRRQQFEITQDVVDRIAGELGIAPPPKIASLDTQSATVELAPTDVAKVVLVREARASQGLPPFGDARDDMTIAQFEAAISGQA
jgi:hypothetical protein